jgi:hypothetical protein
MPPPGGPPPAAPRSNAQQGWQGGIAPAYGGTQSGYGAPQSGYGAPQSGYGAPPPAGYGNANGYAAPQATTASYAQNTWDAPAGVRLCLVCVCVFKCRWVLVWVFCQNWWHHTVTCSITLCVTCVFSSLCVCIVCMRICIYVCIHIHIYIYIYTHTHTPYMYHEKYD